MNESTTLRGPCSRRASYVSTQCILQLVIGENKVGYIYVALMSLKTFDTRKVRLCCSTMHTGNPTSVNIYKICSPASAVSFPLTEDHSWASNAVFFPEKTR